MDILQKLDELHAAGEMHGFSIWPTSDGYQASLAVSTNSFRIRVGETPGDAVEQLMSGDGPLELPHSEPEMLVARDVFEPPLEEIEAGIFD